VWSALGAIYVIWGSTYLAIRVMVETVPPALGAGVRFLLAGVVMLAVLAARRGTRAVTASPRQLAGCAVVGILLAAGGNGLVTVAEQDVPSGLAALLVASTPMWIVLYRTLAGDRVAGGTLAGVGLGFVGVGVLLLPGGRPEHVPLGMALLIVLAAASWGLGSFLAQRVALPDDLLVVTGWQMLCGGAVMTLAGLAAGEQQGLDPGAFSAKSVVAFAYLVLVGSIVAFSCYAWLLRNAPISKVATYAYVNPVIAVVLGAVILSEQVSWATALGSVLIVASVAAIVRRESRAASSTAPGELHEATGVATVPVASRN
jgi:drug/metabolite transporter (DMT)-like permease